MFGVAPLLAKQNVVRWRHQKLFEFTILNFKLVFITDCYLLIFVLIIREIPTDFT